MEKIIKMTLEDIKKYILIREPMLLLDYAEVEPGVRAEGYHIITGEKSVFKGHYPNYPMLPGTYQMEALAQLFSLTFLTLPDRDSGKVGEIPRLVGFENVRFFREVVPECKLELKSNLISFRRGIAKGTAEVYVDGVCTCKLEIKSMIK